MTERQRIKQETWKIITDPVIGRERHFYIRIEALKLLAALNGVLLPDINESLLSVKQALRLRQAKQKLIADVLERKEKRKVENRKAYLRRKLREIERTELDEAMAQQPKQPGNETLESIKSGEIN